MRLRPRQCSRVWCLCVCVFSLVAHGDVNVSLFFFLKFVFLLEIFDVVFKQWILFGNCASGSVIN